MAMLSSDIATDIAHKIDSTTYGGVWRGSRIVINIKNLRRSSRMEKIEKSMSTDSI